MREHFTRRRLLAGVGIYLVGAAVTSGGEGHGEDDDTMTDTTTTKTTTTTTTEPATDKEALRQATRDGLTGVNAFSDSVKEISFGSYHDGDSLGDSLDVRYMLKHGGSADEAERRAGSTLREVVKAVVESGAADSINSIAIFAHVATSDGDDAVSTKFVIHMDEARSIEWQSCHWECVVDYAEQYKFNSQLY